MKDLSSESLDLFLNRLSKNSDSLYGLSHKFLGGRLSLGNSRNELIRAR